MTYPCTVRTSPTCATDIRRASGSFRFQHIPLPVGIEIV